MDSMDSTDTSELSTTSLELDNSDPVVVHESEPVLSTATRVVRSGSTTSLEPAPASADLGRTATPRLVKSASLRRSDSSNTMLSVLTAQGPPSETHTSHSEQGTPKPTHSPALSRSITVVDAGAGSETTMSSAWLDLEDSLVQ